MEQTIQERTNKIKAALAPWIEGQEVVARHNFAFDTEIVVTKTDRGFSLYRGFSLGNGADVSADLQDAPVEILVSMLLEKADY